MSQIVVCQDANGIVLATDSQAIDFNPQGEMIRLKVDRLLQLTQHTAVLAGGAAEGVQMCQALRRFIKEEALHHVEDVYGTALPFLGTEFERFMRKRCETLPLDPIHHVYFILAGYTDKDPERSFRSYLLWTKKRLPQLDGDEISLAYAAPRAMGLEYRLSRLCKENESLDRLLSEVRKGMEQLAGSHDEIGPPFSYATITAGGFQKVA